MKSEKQQFIKIHSDVTIMVTPGLQNKNITNKDSRLEDKLRVQPIWQNAGVLITRGEGLYPAEIAEWPAVKIFARKGIFTIDKDVNVEKQSQEKVEKAKKDAQKLEQVDLSNLANKGE